MNTNKKLITDLEIYKEISESIPKRLYQTQFYKALYQYLDKYSINNETCLFIGTLVKKHSLQSPEIKTYHIYPIGAKDPKNTLRLFIDIISYEYDEDYLEDKTYRVNYMLDVPLNLITNFNNEDFNAYITSVEQFYKKIKLEKAKETLKNIYNEYPELKIL